MPGNDCVQWYASETKTMMALEQLELRNSSY